MATHKRSVGAAVEWMLSKIPGLWKKGWRGRWSGSGWKVRGGLKKEVSR